MQHQPYIKREQPRFHGILDAKDTDFKQEIGDTMGPEEYPEGYQDPCDPHTEHTEPTWLGTIMHDSYVESWPLSTVIKTGEGSPRFHPRTSRHVTFMSPPSSPVPSPVSPPGSPRLLAQCLALLGLKEEWDALPERLQVAPAVDDDDGCAGGATYEDRLGTKLWGAVLRIRPSLSTWLSRS